ncbi:MAG: DUF5701 family protein [Candidatus Andersenbacteria bacterium]
MDRLHSLILCETQDFLVVPPKPDEFDLDSLMALITVQGKSGVNCLNPQYLIDVGAVPQGAHLILDVEDGRRRFNRTAGMAYYDITREGRQPYFLWYGLVHAIVFPGVLQGRYLGLCGSRYKLRVPYLYLDDEVPTLGHHIVCGEDADSVWCAPSAGSVLGA